MADYLDSFGFPMTVAEFLFTGAVDDDTDWGAVEAQQRQEALDRLADRNEIHPALSCAICGEFAGLAVMPNDDRVEATVALMNASSLCFRHWDRRHLLFRGMSVADFIAQERASLNPPAEAAS